MREMHLIQLVFTHSAYGPFTKHKETIQKFKETGDSRHFYQNELDKACFQHDIAYGDFKYSHRRTGSDKTSRDKAFNTAKNPKYEAYQRELTSMVYKCFDKKSASKTFGRGIKSGIRPNQQLADELHKSIIRKFKNHKV